MEATSAQQALARFSDICVANYLDKDALVATLQADKERWSLHTTRRPHDVGGGIYLESRSGETGYVSQPNQRTSYNDPACHFTFIADNKATHKALISLAISKFALREGRDTTSKNSRQMRWDYQAVGAAPARIFVTSNLKANGRTVSRLSISRHRIPKPASLGQTI
jgi:hypothetical protein